MESRQQKKSRSAKYYLEHREEILVRNRAWSLRNKEKHRALIDRWNKENKDRKYAIAKIWEKNNPDKRKIIHQRWYKANPEKCAVMSAKRRTVKTQAGGSYTAKEFRDLCSKYDYRCLRCHRRRKLAADHVVPVSKGGSSNISNIQPLCGPCNSKKHTKIIDYRVLQS